MAVRWPGLSRWYHPRTEPRDLTLSELVDVGPHAGTRLPTALQRALAALRRQQTTFTRATLQVTDEGGQAVAHLTLKVAAECLQDLEKVDEMYEAIEGASTSRLTIRAHLIPLNIPEMHDLPVDADELLPTTDRPAGDVADPEDAWLLYTLGELYDDHFSDTDQVLTSWQADAGLTDPLQLLVLQVVSGRQKAEAHAVQLPEVATLAQARMLTEQLASGRDDLSLSLVATPRISTPPARRPGSVYESAREMARRFRKDQNCDPDS